MLSGSRRSHEMRLNWSRLRERLISNLTYGTEAPAHLFADQEGSNYGTTCEHNHDWCDGTGSQQGILRVPGMAQIDGRCERHRIFPNRWDGSCACFHARSWQRTPIFHQKATASAEYPSRTTSAIARRLIPYSQRPRRRGPNSRSLLKRRSGAAIRVTSLTRTGICGRLPGTRSSQLQRTEASEFLIERRS